MSYEFKLSVPIRSHLKKMINKYKDVDPFVISVGKDHYSGMIYLALQRQTINSYNWKRPEKMNDQLDIIIPQNVGTENRFFIDHKRTCYIDSLLRSVFDEKLMEYLNYNCHQKGDVLFFCQQFMKIYGITEEEITLDALVKSYQRFRHGTGLMDKKRFRSKVNHHRTPTIVNPHQIMLFD